MNSPLIVATAMVITTAACGATYSQTVLDAKATLQGEPAERLKTCIGEPATLVKQGRQLIATYSSAQARGPDGLTLPTAGAAEDPKACVFTFTISDRVIQSISSKNRAGWGGGSITKCAELVQACVVPAQRKVKK